MEPVILAFEYVLADWLALHRAMRRRVNAQGDFLQRQVLARLPVLLPVLLVVCALFLIHDHAVRQALMLGALAGVLLFAIPIIVLSRRYRPRPGGMFLGAVQFTLDTHGVRYLRAGVESHVAWQRVQGVEFTPTHVFVWLDAVHGYVLPARGLPAPMTCFDLAERIRGFIAAAGTAPVPLQSGVESAHVAMPAETGAAAGEPEAQPAVWRELAAIGRLLVALRVDSRALAGRDLTIFVLGAILLAIWFPLDLLAFPGELEFNAYAPVSVGWVIAGVAGLAWILSRLARPALPYRRALLLATGSLPIAIVVSTIYALMDPSWIIAILGLALLWSALYFGRGLRALSGQGQPVALYVALAAVASFVVAGDLLYVNPSFWQYPDDDEQTEADSPDTDPRTWQRMEELQFGQQARLDEELARMAALPRGKSATFFVGFAGYGEQRVFAQEIELARRQIAIRYGTAPRSIELVNDQRDPEGLPLASEPALRYTLESIGSMMRPDDVLFLALSSHGSEDGSIAVSNAGRAPTELQAVDLADMLRDAKIPWKVIVVSACYAGGFIDPLRDDHTIVIAAAAQDRTSFGCADDRDLTYFGEAFYRDAFPKAVDLRAAFETARAAIAKREKREGVEPSDPQAYFGAAIEAKLK